jgi:hypothetical protein
MKLRIKNIVLYPKDHDKPKRIVAFELEKVNVITGESHKGKSALVHIIDYCLGSEKCSIPVGVVRKYTQWFGVHIICEKTELLLLRKEPGNQISTSEMIMVEQVSPIDLNNISNAEHYRTNREAVINRLNQLSNLSTERFDLENPRNHFGGAASFRDTSAFQFQPQHIVANPFALFYKADTFEHQQKLRTIFPLIIGSITNEALNLEREIKEIENQLKKLQSELSTKRQAVEAWINDLRSLFNRSVQLGLVRDLLVNSTDFNADQYLSQLKLVVSNFNENPVPVYQSGTSEKDVQLQYELSVQERVIQNEIGIRKTRLSKMVNLNSSTTQYKLTLTTQKRRLEPIGWFKEKLQNEHCPFCDSKNDTAQKQIDSLSDFSKELEIASEAVNTKDVNLDKEIADIRHEIREFEAQLNSNRNLLRDIYSRSAEEGIKRQTTEDIYKFVGRLEQALENVISTDIDGDLDIRIKDLQENFNIKNSQLKEIKAQYSQQNILRRISRLISHYVELLDIDRKDDAVELDVNNLTVKIASGTANRSDFLWEVGSGANWMGYHLSTMFALHEHFLSLKHNFVPSFLVIDQPSQVYFPKTVPRAGGAKTFREFASKSDDLTQTRKIFESASDCLKRTKGKFQIIILEHAPKITWEGIANIHLVEDWSGDKALIPKDWIG